MSAHYGEELELFALGDLEPNERAAIEAHLTECAECTRRVGEAEETLAHMSTLLPSYRAPRRNETVWRPTTRVAVAAAFVAGLLAAALALAFVNPSGAFRQDELAQVAMTHSHFEHIELEPVAVSAPAAKVVYAHDHSWLYAIVDDGRPGYHLLVGKGSADLADTGGLTAHGNSSSLFLAHPPPGDRIELFFDGHEVARGTLR